MERSGRVSASWQDEAPSACEGFVTCCATSAGHELSSTRDLGRDPQEKRDRLYSCIKPVTLKAVAFKAIRDTKM